MILYPAEFVASEIELLVSKILKSSGGAKKAALLELKIYADLYGLDANELIYKFEKNIDFYNKEYKTNNPDLSKTQRASAQQAALTKSFEQTVIASDLEAFQKQNIDKLFRWLPSGANQPDDRHMQFYGKTYAVANPPDGELPGQRPGCQCGLELLQDEI